jgi:hypothetical protein
MEPHESVTGTTAVTLRIADPEPAGRPIPTDPDALLFTAEAAYLRGQSPRTLEKERVAGGGCPFVLLGRSVRYRRCDVLDHVEQRVRYSTSDRQARSAAGAASGGAPGAGWRNIHRAAGPGAAVMSGEPAGHVNFAAINAAALRALPALLARWLPDGKQLGIEWVVRNPKRADRHAGSFKVNLRTGRWGDFASGDFGGDPISLAAYLSGLGQVEAAHELARALGIKT